MTADIQESFSALSLRHNELWSWPESLLYLSLGAPGNVAGHKQTNKQNLCMQTTLVLAGMLHLSLFKNRGAARGDAGLVFAKPLKAASTPRGDWDNWFWALSHLKLYWSELETLWVSTAQVLKISRVVGISGAFLGGTRPWRCDILTLLCFQDTEGSKMAQVF